MCDLSAWLSAGRRRVPHSQPCLRTLTPVPPSARARAQDAAEFGRIGRYYATESMLVWDDAAGRYAPEATPSYGRDTLEDFFARAVREGGLEGQELGDAAVF